MTNVERAAARVAEEIARLDRARVALDEPDFFELGIAARLPILDALAAATDLLTVAKTIHDDLVAEAIRADDDSDRAIASAAGLANPSIVRRRQAQRARDTRSADNTTEETG